MVKVAIPGAAGDENVTVPGSPGTVTTERYPAEWHRIGFLCTRDGPAAASEFCLRTSRIYRSAVLASAARGHRHPHFASNPEYRARFIASYLDFKRFHLAQAPRRAQ